MNRILFAAARGARVQYFFRGKRWLYAQGITFTKQDPSPWRIHPDDAHLEYGPVSSAMRGMVVGHGIWKLDSPDIPKWILMALIACGMDDDWAEEWKNQTPDDRRIAWLLMAESLADEGL